MKVKTDYVPENCDYLTVGKVYDVTFDGCNEFSAYGYIFTDVDVEAYIRVNGCSHLEGLPWTIVEE